MLLNKLKLITLFTLTIKLFNMTLQDIQNHINLLPSKEIEQLNDKYHSFKELYEFRKVYNAVLFNEWANSKEELLYALTSNPPQYVYKPKYDVHKSWKHNDGEPCFGGDWFIVSAMLPSGLISNHYHKNDWDIFKIPEVEKAKYSYDGYTSQDVLQRLLNLK